MAYNQEWNKSCRYYCEDSYGEKSCSIGMDMTFCTKDCAYGSNVKGHTEVYKEDRILRGKRK